MVDLARKCASVLLSVSLVWTCGIAPSAWADDGTGAPPAEATSRSEATEQEGQTNQADQAGQVVQVDEDRASSEEGVVEEGPSPEDSGSIEVVAEGETDDTVQDESHDVEQDGRVDVADVWEAGGAIISAGGEYWLSRDIETDGMLAIDAPAGEKVTFDFSGHTATVRGAVYAGIDVGASLGEVEITDSTYESGEPEGGLSVTGMGTADALCGIQANYRIVDEKGLPSPELTIRGISVDVRLAAVDQGSNSAKHDSFGVYVGFAYDEDARKPADVVIADVKIEVSVGAKNKEIDSIKDIGLEPVVDGNAGVAYGIHAASKLVVMGGRFESTTESSGGACDLYSAEAESFVLASYFDPHGTMRVFAEDNEDGKVLATAQEGLFLDEGLLAHFSCVTEGDTALVIDGNGLRFVAGEEADGDGLDGENDEQEESYAIGGGEVHADNEYDESGETYVDGNYEAFSGDERGRPEEAYADGGDEADAETTYDNDDEKDEEVPDAISGTKDEPALSGSMTEKGIQRALKAQEDEAQEGEIPDKVSITIHSNWPVKGLEERTQVLEGHPGDAVEPISIEEFECERWNYRGTNFLNLNSSTGELEENALFNSLAVTWTFPDEPIDLFINWQRNESRISVQYYKTVNRYVTVEYVGYEGEPILDEEGAAITGLPNVIDRPGYRFLGWRKYVQFALDGDSNPSFPEVYPSGTMSFQQLWTEDTSSTPTVSDVDLYPLLTTDGVPNSRIVTLSSQGTYYLSQSVDGFKGRIVFASPGNYDVDLLGNTITFGSDSDTAVNMNRVVRIGGASPPTTYRGGDESPYNVRIRSTKDGGGFHFKNSGGIEVGPNSSLELSDINILKDYTVKDKVTDYRTQNQYAIYTIAPEQVYGEEQLPKVQNITIDSCTITFDASNQTAGGSSKPSYRATATAVLLTSPNMEGARISNSSIVARSGKPDKTSDTQGSVDAVAVYLRATSAKQVVIEDSTLTAEAAQGSAYAIVRFHYSEYGPSREAAVKLYGNVSIKATGSGEGERLSVGVLNTTKTRSPGSDTGTGSPAILDGKLSFESSSKRNAFALMTDPAISSDGAGFVIGEAFDAENPLVVSDGAYFEIDRVNGADSEHPMLPLSSSNTANRPGCYIASFGFAADGDTATAIASRIACEEGADGIRPVADSEGICFGQDPSSAEAYILRNGGAAVYGDFSDVAMRAKSGEVIVLNKDTSDALEFPETMEELASEHPDDLAWTVDLNGHSAAGFLNKSAGRLTVVDLAEQKGEIRSSTGVGITQDSIGVLVLDGVEVESSRSSGFAYGLQLKNGTVILQGGSKIRAVSSGSFATGVSVNGILRVRDARIIAESGASQAATGVSLNKVECIADIGPDAVISAAGNMGTIFGVRVEKGSSTIAGTIRAESSGGAQALYGVYASRGTTVELAGASIESLTGTDAETNAPLAWGIYCDNAGLTLGGECAFDSYGTNSSIDIYHVGGAFAVADDFALLDDSGDFVTVVSSGISEDIFAVPKEDGEELRQKQSLFVAAETSGNEYAGCLSFPKGESLAWKDAEGTVAITDGECYASIQAAVRAAEEGGIVTVLEDHTSLPLATSKAVTVDLSGHDVVIGGGIESGGAPSGVAVRNGRLTITDSGSNRGSLVIAPATTQDVGILQGISVEDGGALTLDDCDARVHGGASATVSKLVGVSASSSGVADGRAVVEMSGSAALRVGSSTIAIAVFGDEGSDRLTGALNVVGVESKCPEDIAAVSIAEECAVEAKTTTSAISAGQIIRNTTGGWNLGARESALYSARVRLFDPSDDEELYNAIVKQFKRVAKFDESSSDGVYGAHIYYASPMEITEGEFAGTYVWAFSKPVALDDIGKDEFIVPEKIYVQSTYQNIASAIGVDCAKAGRGCVRLAGAVSAESTTGKASALRVDGGSLTVIEVCASARLSAETHGTSYWTVSAQPPNLHDALGIEDESVVFYGKDTFVREIVLTDVTAYAIEVGWFAGVGSEQRCTVRLDGTPELSAAGAHSSEIRAQLALLSEDFAGEGIRVVGLDGKNAAGAVFASSANGLAVDAGQRDAFIDGVGACMPVLTDGGKSVAWGAVRTVRFLDSYGTTIAQDVVAEGYGVSLPLASLAAKPDTGTKTYEFVGWSEDPKARADDDGLITEDFIFHSDSFHVDNDAVALYPVYREQPRKVEYSFSGARDSEGNVLKTARIEVSAGTGMGAESLADVPVAADYGIYRFVGWETYDSDAKALKVVDPTCLSRVASEEDVSFAARYVGVSSWQQLVVFKVDDTLYPYSVGGGELPSYRDAVRAVTGSSDIASISLPMKSETGVNWSFVGWNAGSHDYAAGYPDRVDYSADAVLAPVESGGGPVFYTAVFSKNGNLICTVLLYYFANWGSDGAPDWKYNDADDYYGRNKKYVAYGTDLSQLKAGVAGASVDRGLDGVSLMDYAEQTAQGAWRAHRFLGWSVRKSDKQPMADLPLVGEGERTGMMSSSTAYYAVYSDEEMQVEASFVMGDQSLAADVPESGTLEDALVALAKTSASSSLGSVSGESFTPNTPEGKQFVGWSATEGGVAIGNPSLSKIVNAASFDAPKGGDGRSEGAVTYYAVFADADAQIAEVALDGQGADNWGQQVATFTGVEVGSSLLLPEDYKAPRRGGYAFTGWNSKADGSGRSFDLDKDAVDSRNLTLYAQYEPIDTAYLLVQGASADVARACTTQPGAYGADVGGVKLLLQETSASDAAIALGQRDRAVANYRMRAVATRSGSTVDITEQLEGAVSLTLPVSSKYLGKELLVFVKTTAGESKAYKTELDVAKSSVSVSVLGVGASDSGNIVIANRLTEAEYSLELAKSNAKSQLSEIADGYSRADYTEDNWDAIGNAASEGYAAIDAATSVSAVRDAAQAASDAMAAIPAKAGVDAARADGLERLAESFAGYDKSAYTDENWKKLEEAYKNAKKKVSSAETVALANKAASDGVLAMANVKAGTGSSSSSSSGSNSSSDGSNGSSSSGGSGGLAGSSSSASSSVGENTGSSNSSGLSSSNNTGSRSSNGSGLSSSNDTGSGSSGGGLSSTTSTGLSTSTGSGLASSAGGLSSSTGLTSTTGTSSALNSSTSNGQSGLTSTSSSDPTASQLGAKLTTLTKDLASEKGIKEASGVYVESVVEGGPLDKAGIEKGDVIVGVDGANVSTKEDLGKALASKKAGDVVELTVRRDGKSAKYKVTLGDSSALASGSAGSSEVLGNASAGKGLFGDAGNVESGADGDGSDAVGPGQALPLFPLLIVLAAGMAVLSWWLLKRRNLGDDLDGDGDDPDDDFWEEAPAAA